VPATIHEKVYNYVLAKILPILECDVNSPFDVCWRSEPGAKGKYGHPTFWVVAINVEYGGIDHLANVRTV
jgi:hypothetical protein